MLLLSSWQERKQFYCVVAQCLFALLKCLEKLRTEPLFASWCSYFSFAELVWEHGNWETLHCRSVSRGLAGGTLWMRGVCGAGWWCFLYSKGMAHSPARGCLWQVRFTKGPLEQGGPAYLHPRMAIQPVASLGRSRKGWHNPEQTWENFEGIEKGSSNSCCGFVTKQRP